MLIRSAENMGIGCYERQIVRFDQGVCYVR